MKAHSLSIIAALTLGLGFTALGQMGQGVGRSIGAGPSGGSFGVSGGGGGSYRSAPSGGSYGSYDSGSSGGSNRTTSSGSSGSSTSGGSSSSGSSGGYYDNSGYYNGGYSSGGYSNGSSSTSVNKSASGASVFRNTIPSYGNTPNAEETRNKSLNDIRNTLSTFDRSSQHYTVSGTEPSTLTGAGGTMMRINPADLETVDGQPITDDIEVELKELDGPAKMALAGAPTMSNGDVLISGGSYYFGMTSGGQDVRLRKGSTMDVALPRIVDDPDMQVYTGVQERNGSVNWQPTNRPLTDAGVANTSNDFRQPTAAGASSTPGNNSAVGATPGRGNDTFTGPGRENTNGGEGGNTNVSGPRNPNGNGSGSGTGNATNAPAGSYYSMTGLNSLGWVNADKAMRGGVKMFVEVEGADPLSTQVYILFKDVKTLAEGVPDKSYTTNDFIFENLPRNKEVKVVAISKIYDKVYAGEMKTESTARNRVTVVLKETTASEAAKLFEKK